MTKTEKLSHYSVVLIAVLAVVVSIWQVRISQEHNKLSVRPYMDFFYGWNEKGNLQLNISNQGVGPAIITEVSHSYKGQKFKRWDDLLKATDLSQYRVNSYQYGGKSPFASGNEINFLELSIPEDQRGLIDGIQTTIRYESIYEEEFSLVINF